MALVLKDRVKETSVSTGTGAITLDGAVGPYQAFSTIGNGNQTYYAIAGQTTSEWEVGIGTYTSSTDTLSRDTILSSSNSNNIVTFSAGTKDVFITYPSEKAIYEEPDGDTLINAGPITVLGPGVSNAPPPTPYSDTLGRFYGNVDSYQQVYIQNQYNGVDASTDLVAYNDLGDGTNYFIDMGMTSSTYSSASYPIFSENCAYVYNSGLTTGTGIAGETSELLIGTGTLNSDLVLFTGGVDTTNEAVRISGADQTIEVQKGVTLNETLDVTGAATFGSAVLLDADPTLALQAATKQYVDTAVSTGLHLHQPVLVATTANLTATYNNGTAGVGATLTNSGTQVALAIDGINMATTNRVLVWQQTSAAQNGIYDVTTVGSGATNWVLTRSSDANTYVAQSDTGLGGGDYFFVQSGTTGAGDSYVCTNDTVIVFGTTPITFAQFSGAITYTGGTNINVTGQVISLTGTVAPTNGGTGVNTVTTGDLLYGSASNTWSKLAVGSAYQSLVVNGSGTQVEWNAVNLSNSAAVTGSLGATYGGTGQTTYALGDTLYSSASNTLAKLSGNTSTTKQYLSQTGTGSASAAPSWATISAADIGAGTLPAVRGGTGQSSYAIGDLLYADTTTTLAKLAATATGRVLISNGVSAAPSWSTSVSLGAITGTSITDSGLTSGRITFASTGGLLADSANLVWDNTNARLGVNATTTYSTLHVGGAVANNWQSILATGVSNTNFRLVSYNGDTGTASGTLQAKFGLTYNDFTTATDSALFKFYRGAGAADGFLTVVTNQAERMRIDSAGNVGIGSTLSNTNNKVLIRKDGVNTITNALMLNNGTADNQAGTGVSINLSGVSEANANIRYAYIQAATASTGNDHYLAFGTNASAATPTEKMRLDSAGNLGLGVTPSAWSVGKAFELGGVGAGLWNAGTAGDIFLTSNAYYNAGWKYAATNASTYYEQNAGIHRWSNAPSGTAGNAITFTTAMTLDTSGFLGVGMTTSYGKVSIANTAASGGLHLSNGTTDTGGYLNSTGTSEIMVSGGASYNTYSAPNFVMNAKTTVASGIYFGSGATSFWNNTGLTAGTTFNQTERMRITSAGLVNIAGLTASSAVATDASKNLVSVTNTGTGNNVLATSPTLVTPNLGTPASGTLTNCTFPTLNQNTTGSSGSCTGNAATASNASLLNSISAVNLYNNMGDVHSTRSSFDATGATLTSGFGYRYVTGSTNSPGTNGATQYYAWNIGLGSEYASTTYAAQFALPRDVTTPYLSVRYEEAGVLKAWQKIAAGSADSSSFAGGAVWENSLTIAANYTMTAGKSGTSAGPITINSGVTVTIPSGSRWVVL